MSETSTSYTSAFTSTTVVRNEMVSLVNKIKKYDMVKLIEYLWRQGLNFMKNDFDIIENEKVDGQDFFNLTQEELERYRMKLGSAKRLVKFAKECKDKKLRLFSLYKTKKDLGVEQVWNSERGYYSNPSIHSM